MDMKILVLCDDMPHPAVVVRDGLAALDSRGLEFDWLQNGAEWSAERMTGYRVVVLAKANNTSSSDGANWVTEDNDGLFTDFVAAGGGLLVIHGGIAGYAHLPLLRALMGGAFVKHPPQCPVTLQPTGGHPLAEGCTPATVRDEHFFVTLDDDESDVFLTTQSENGTQPGGWTRTEGEGRVCVLTPGHNPEVWACPSFQALLRNALVWCGGKRC
jgi:hypothetical protein